MCRAGSAEMEYTDLENQSGVEFFSSLCSGLRAKSKNSQRSGVQWWERCLSLPVPALKPLVSWGGLPTSPMTRANWVPVTWLWKAVKDEIVYLIYLVDYWLGRKRGALFITFKVQVVELGKWLMFIRVECKCIITVHVTVFSSLPAIFPSLD